MSEPHEGYVLDGIETAMQATPRSDAGYILAPKIECPCGWVAPDVDVDLYCDPAALRFHYTHCPKAKRLVSLEGWISKPYVAAEGRVTEYVFSTVRATGLQASVRRATLTFREDEP